MKHKVHNKYDRILSVSSKLISRKGYNGTSFQEIANKVGLGKSSLFHYVKNKEELLLRILEKNIDEVNINLRKIINNNRLEPEEKLKEAFENHLALLIKYSDNVTIYLNELGNLSKKNQLIYLNKRKKYGEEFQKIVVELKKKGYFEGLNEKIIVLGLLGMLNLVVKWYKKDGPLTINEISNIFYRTIIEK